MKSVDSREKLFSTANDLINKFDHTFRGEAWRDVLKAIGVMGVIDNQQLIKASVMERDSLAYILTRIDEISEPNKLFKQVKLKVQRGKQHRNPKIFCLTDLGAALLRIIGLRNSLGYGETNPIAISHDLCIVDLFQLARKSKLEVKLEERIYFSEKEYLVPDLLLKMENGLPIFFEIEQAVHPNYLRRMAQSLRRRLSFFSSDTGKLYSSDIRMLFNLPATGNDVESAIERWKNVLDILSTENGNRLPFRVMAMSIHSFLDSPKWTSDFDNCWIDVLKHSPVQKKYYPVNITLPTDLAIYRQKDDLLVLNALSQWFEEISLNNQNEYALPNQHFFEIIQLIYLASHQPNHTSLEKAVFPYASLFLFRRYLLIHPNLKNLLKRTTDWDRFLTRSSPTTILNRIQHEIDIFLNYHGWNNRDQLVAYPIIAAWSDEGPKDYEVKVKISSWEILFLESTDAVSTENKIHSMEKMLAWVLWAMVSYGDKIGLLEKVY